MLWTWKARRWGVVAGGIVTLIGMSTFALFVNPRVFEQYHLAMTDRPPQMLSPTLGALLRLAFGIDRIWLQYVPVAIGICWFVAYWLRHHRQWSWAEQTPLLLFASLLTTNYGAWPFDLVIFLVPLIQTAVGICTTRSPALFAGLVLVAFNALAILTMDVHWAEQYRHAWMTPMLLCGYLILRRQESPDLTRTSLFARA
jgi:hypothetical protein